MAAADQVWGTRTPIFFDRSPRPERRLWKRLANHGWNAAEAAGNLTVSHAQKIKWGLITGAMFAAVFGYAYFINM